MFEKLKVVRGYLDRLAPKVAFVGPLLIRVTVGTVFIGTGWAKLHSLGDVTAFFASLHIPAPGFNAALASCTEFFGGILILLGLGARLAALPLSFTMVVAILTAKLADVDGFTALVGLEEWSYLVMFLTIAFIGPGAASLDHLLSRWAATRPLPKPLLRPADPAVAKI